MGEQCSEKSRPWVHYGLTSNDILDTTISTQMRDAFFIIESKILDIAIAMSDKALEFRALPAVGRTHGQLSKYNWIWPKVRGMGCRNGKTHRKNRRRKKTISIV